MSSHTKPWERRRAAKLSITNDSRFHPQTLIVAGFLVAGVIIALLFSAWTSVDHRQVFDDLVETDWLTGRELVDAAEFFAKGGVFENSGAEDNTMIDQKYVVPLIGRLKHEQQLDFQVILLEKDPPIAYALIAQVPSDRAARNAIRAAILQAADEFPGLIFQKWGHEWLALDFFDEQELTFLKQAGVVNELKDSQRRME